MGSTFRNLRSKKLGSLTPFDALLVISSNSYIAILRRWALTVLGIWLGSSASLFLSSYKQVIRYYWYFNTKILRVHVDDQLCMSVSASTFYFPATFPVGTVQLLYHWSYFDLMNSESREKGCLRVCSWCNFPLKLLSNLPAESNQVWQDVLEQ